VDYAAHFTNPTRAVAHQLNPEEIRTQVQHLVDFLEQNVQQTFNLNNFHQEAIDLFNEVLRDARGLRYIVETLRTQHDADMESRRAQRQTESDNLARQHEVEIENYRQDNQAEIDSLLRLQQAENLHRQDFHFDLDWQHQAEAEDLRQVHEADERDLRSDHENQDRDLRVRHENQVRNLGNQAPRFENYTQPVGLSSWPLIEEVLNPNDQDEDEYLNNQSQTAEDLSNEPQTFEDLSNEPLGSGDPPQFILDEPQFSFDQPSLFEDLSNEAQTVEDLGDLPQQVENLNNLPLQVEDLDNLPTQTVNLDVLPQWLSHNQSIWF